MWKHRATRGKVPTGTSFLGLCSTRRIFESQKDCIGSGNFSHLVELYMGAITSLNHCQRGPSSPSLQRVGCVIIPTGRTWKRSASSACPMKNSIPWTIKKRSTGSSSFSSKAPNISSNTLRRITGLDQKSQNRWMRHPYSGTTLFCEEVNLFNNGFYPSLAVYLGWEH